MKTLLSVFISCLIVINVFAQPNSDDEKIIRSIADNILKNTSWDFINRNNGEILKSVNEESYSPAVQIRSPYNTWNYWNGVLNIAMIDFAEYFNEPSYKQFSIKNYEFAFDNVAIFQEKYTPEMNKWSYPFGQYIVTRELDDCGAMGGGLIEVYKDVIPI
ncbi:MAG: hypothetical protein HQ541_23750 [Mariniphaga sp.]|nr:hypothetical protein [Mariniphaga sp.]